MQSSEGSSDLPAMASVLNQHRVIPVLRHIAHDLNNSVWSILANLEVLGHLVSPDDESLQELLKSTQTAVERASMDCRRATSMLKTTTANRIPIELAPALESVATIVRQSLPTNVHLIVDQCPESVVAATSHGDLLLLIWSLANNSVIAIRSDQGTIRITTSVTQDQEYAVVTVKDDGCGMDPEMLTNCQEAFAGVDMSKLGIGLTAVSETLYSHRGKAEVTSEVGVGTTIQLFFPQ